MLNMLTTVRNRMLQQGMLSPLLCIEPFRTSISHFTSESRINAMHYIPVIPIIRACTCKAQNSIIVTSEVFVYTDCTNQKLLLWQNLKEVDPLVIPCCWSSFSASSAWGNTLCRACKILKSVLPRSGFIIGDKARPGEGTALCDAGTVFCIAITKSFAFILIELTSSCNFSLLE